jgi:hypothetical protein
VEHVAFLIEESGTLIRCLLNPETLVIRRSAGVRTRPPTAGRQPDSGQQDDIVFFTGGGRTELDLDLLFDIDLPGSSIQTQNVRDLTGPIWQLAENSAQSQGIARPPQVRFLWGKVWNIPGVVLAIAERFESFTSDGVARRSWLRMRLLRVSDTPRQDLTTQSYAAPSIQQPTPGLEVFPSTPGEPGLLYQPFSLASPEEEPLPAGPPGAVDPDALLSQALADNPMAVQALAETSQAIEAIAGSIQQTGLQSEALNNALQEMQSGLQSVTSGSATSSLTSAVVQIAAAQAAASQTLADLPGDQPGVQETRQALDSLAPAMEKMAQAQAQVAQDAQQQAAGISAGAAAQLLEQSEVAVSQIEPGSPFVTEPAGPSSPGAEDTPPGEEKPKEPVPEPAPEPKPEPTPEPAPEPAPEPEPEPAPEPAPEPSPEPTPEPAPQPAPVPAPEPADAESSQDVSAAFNEIRRSAERIRTQGEIAQGKGMMERLVKIAEQTGTAWAKNNDRSARSVMQALLSAGHNLQAAESIRQAVSPGALLAKAAADLRGCFQSIAPGQADIPLAFWEALRRLEAIGRFVLAAAAPELTLPDGCPESTAAQDIAAQISQGIRMLGGAENNPDALKTIQSALEKLDALVKIRLEEEAKQAGGQVCSASESIKGLPGEWISPAERLDQIAFRHYHNPAYWRLLAQANQIDNPLQLAPNQPLVIPPKPRAQKK